VRQIRIRRRAAVGRRRDLTLLAVAALATGLVGAGCGRDDGDGGESLSKEESVPQAKALGKEESLPQANAPSKKGFVARANEICRQGNAELQAVAQESLGRGMATPEDHNAFATETLAPNVQGQIDDISALGIPDGDEDTVNGFLDEAEGILDQLERDPESFSTDPFAQVKEDFAAYGLTACGPDVGG
jgi:hypothetical protein